jgi:hypothetical protein
MNKTVVLEHLRAAKAAHIKWVQKAKLLISGLPIKEDAIPVDSTECKFGKWFYGEGQKLNAMPNNSLDCMTKIETLHFELHDIYLKIFKIYFNKPQKGFMSKVFGNKKKELSADELSDAKQHYDDMESISRELLDEIGRLERRLLAIPEEELSKVI